MASSEHSCRTAEMEASSFLCLFFDGARVNLGYFHFPSHVVVSNFSYTMRGFLGRLVTREQDFLLRLLRRRKGWHGNSNNVSGCCTGGEGPSPSAHTQA